QLETPVSTRLSRTLNLYPGQNNILSPDSKLPIALEFDYTVKGSSETMGFAQNFREVARTEHIEHRPMFLKTSKFYKKAEEYEISMDTVFFDTDLDESQLNGQEFFVEVLKDDETTELETLYSGCYLEAMSDTEDPVRKKGLRLVCQERIL
ncbi:MAG: hypothetical protein GXX80_10905, partial [Thermotogaceae bacterium]|nr:hypothetical protein [Thermotogaceae bacterium]